MPGQLTGHPSGTVMGGEVVDRADVVETAAGDIVAAGSVRASHDPRGAQRNGMDLVGGVGIPDDELAVLRCRDQVAPIRRPMHGIYLG